MSINTIKQAIQYSNKDSRNMQNAMVQMMQLEGWSKEETPSKFVEFCLQGATEYKKTHSYMLVEANDASNVALFIDNALGQIIIDRLAANS